ncbi:MAG: hypothetical protein IJ955_01665 [Oscillospiraceae bacterium]|nr:hypothetical protein [Oscillospiraceae bacterium]
MDSEFKRLKDEEFDYFQKQRKKNDVAEFDYHLLDVKPKNTTQKNNSNKGEISSPFSSSESTHNVTDRGGDFGKEKSNSENSPMYGIDTSKNIHAGSFGNVTQGDLVQEEKENKLSWENIFSTAFSAPDTTLPLSNTTQITNDLRSSSAQVAYEKSMVSQFETQKEKSQQQINDWAKEHPVIASAASLVSSPLSGVDYLDQLVQYQAIGETVPGGNMGPGELTQTLRTGASEDMSNTGKLLYHVGMSTADSLIAGKLSGGISAVGGLIQAGGTVSSTADDIRARGGTDEQALAGGAAAGAIEALMESLSLGNLNELRELPVSDLKTFLKNMEKSVFVNFGDEFLTSSANALFDVLHMGDISNYALSVDNYIASGMSEQDAKKAAKVDIARQSLIDGVSGALIGIGMGTAAQVINSETFDSNAFADKLVKDCIIRKNDPSTEAYLSPISWDLSNVVNPFLPQMRPAFAMDGYDNFDIDVTFREYPDFKTDFNRISFAKTGESGTLEKPEDVHYTEPKSDVSMVQDLEEKIIQLVLGSDVYSGEQYADMLSRRSIVSVGDDLKTLSIDGNANSIMDLLYETGTVKQRRLYGSDGKALLDYDTDDHGRPKWHPTGAHRHLFDYSNKNPHGKWRTLTAEDLALNQDIIQEGVNYFASKIKKTDGDGGGY